LKYNIVAARDAGNKVLLTFGGAYSNHLQATAAAGHYFGFSTVGVVRGEEHSPLNTILAKSVELGMTLTYVDRAQYRQKTNPDYIDQLREEFGDFYLIPEGGSNRYALQGCSELPSEIDVPFDVLCCASGTGATLAGIATALRDGRRAIGFSALKGGSFLVDDVNRFQKEYGRVTHNWSIQTDFHFGGFARREAELDDFIVDFHDQHEVMLDWVYEGKMMYGLFTLLKQGSFTSGTRIVALLA
jgi:1-aminocyclopropane-1-carboxylate deaminase